MPSLATINYFLPPQGYFWAWSDDAAAEWEDGTTVAVWEELEAIVSDVAVHGLPPLGAIVLILAACGDAWPRRWPQVRHAAAASTGETEPLRTTERLLRPVEDGLKRIHALPEDLRRGVRARCGLITAIFEDVFNRLPPVVAAEIVSDAKREGVGFRAHHKPDLGIHMRLLRDLSALDAAFSKMDLTHLEERLRTGVDGRIIAPAELPPLDSPGTVELPLLEQLARQRNTELSGIAILARRVVAMISVPRLAGQLQALPIGGISDISNRGDFTRLLLGELAWDEEMFSARLAHNEALFYRREHPPDAPQSVRSLLLDHGIRLWGLPRLYALAVALGLANQGKARAMDVQTWRRDDSEFRRIALETVSDVQAHLAALSSSVCPAEALNAWEPNAVDGQQHDVFFIAQISTLQSTAVTNALYHLSVRSGGALRLFTIALGRDGTLELAQRSIAGQRALAKCRLNLDLLLPAPPESPRASKAHLPSRRLYALDQKIARLAFYRQWPLPMRLRAIPETGQQSNGGWENCIVAVDTKQRLMAWTDPAEPATELAAGLPKARSYWVDPQPGAFFSVVCSALKPGERVKLCRQNRGPEAPEVLELNARHSFPRRVTFGSGAAILHYQGGAEAFSLTTGLRIAEMDFLPGLSLSVFFDGDTLRIGGAAEEDRRFPKAEQISAVDAGNIKPPLAVGIVDEKLALIWEQEVRVWFAARKHFEVFQRQRPARSVALFNEVPGTSFSGNIVPAFWHAHSSAADFFYDNRGILHIVIPEAQVALPVFSSIATDVWTDPPKSGRKTIAEVESRMLILTALK